MKNALIKVRRWLGRPRLIRQTRPVIIDEDSACENPIFLIGCHRSGTSLVRRVFNSHRDIACPPETYFLEHYAQMATSDRVANGFLGFGLSRREMQLELRKQARRMHESFRLAEGKRRWADKTPQYADCLDGLMTLFGGNSRYVMIYRHPFDVAASIYEKGWRFLNKDKDLFIDTLFYVLQVQRTQMEFELRHKSKCVRLHYEKLNADPTGELTRVLEFLGEKFDPDMLNFSSKAHNFGTEDLIVRSSNGFQMSQGKWSAWSIEKYTKACEILQESSEALGYLIPNYDERKL